ncbi:hypothetical protein N9845_03450, partial [Akkermansiaceae bacterium]|nr:hypothetical protein [Akkermansiaceae bacterium]
AGPGMIVTEDCGIKVDAGNRKKILKGLTSAILSLDGGREQWLEIQDAAIARAATFSWESVARELDRAYQDSFLK